MFLAKSQTSLPSLSYPVNPNPPALDILSATSRNSKVHKERVYAAENVIKISRSHFWQNTPYSAHGL